MLKVADGSGPCVVPKPIDPTRPKGHGKIRTTERKRHESFYLPAEQYTAVVVEPVPEFGRRFDPLWPGNPRNEGPP